MRFVTPLRYPGGKRKLTNFFKVLFEQNSLTDGHYVEPYAGGAGVALSLLLHEYVSKIHLNDINRSLYAFWYSAINYSEELCKMIHKSKLTMEEWSRQKEVQQNPKSHSILELGYSTFFLNRTNRSGIVWGGVIGGKEQKGPWKIDARFNKSDLISRIETISRYSERIHLYNLDAEEFIQYKLPNIPSKTLVYFDPPYYKKGKGLYENHYQHADHKRVANRITRINDKKWVVSYDNVPEIKKLYKSHPCIIYGLKYSAQERYEGSEVMYFGPGLKIPKVDNPAKVKAA